MRTTRVEELEHIINKARNELGIIRDKEEAEQNKKLIGKCFKYRNCYSCPEKESDYWMIYGRVIGITRGGLLMFSFQTDKYGKIEIYPREVRYGNLDGMGWIPIAASVFNAAWSRLQKKIKAIDAERSDSEEGR